MPTASCQSTAYAVKVGKCGVQCGGDMVLGLLFADDTSLVASDKEGLEKSMDAIT